MAFLLKPATKPELGDLFKAEERIFKMCSFFGAGEKLEAKIEDLVKKFEDRFADIEDKVMV